MADGFIVLSDDSSGEERSAPPAFATKSTASHEPPRRNIAVKKGTSVPQPQPSPTISAQQKNKSDLKTLQFSSNFLDNFNPQNSRREKNKRRTQQQQTTTRTQNKKTYNYTAIYDEQGRLKVNNQDICDCFDMLCPGCHFPCHYCASQKCGMRCRVNRKFMYDAIEHDGKDLVLNNPFLANVL